MAEKIPVKIENRDENKFLNALQKLLSSLQQIDLTNSVFKAGLLLHLEGIWTEVPQIMYNPAKVIS